jgi:hypothetical protein
MERRYVAFDIETAAEVPDDASDWRQHRPLGITCVAMLRSDDDEPIIWHGRHADGSPAPRMARDEAAAVVEFLEQCIADGYSVLTWNGLGFDFDILAEEADALTACRALALDHVDMMFHVVCARGFPVALDKAAHALGLPGKPEGMSGSLAPTLWAEGRHQEVLDYVGQDVRIALAIARACEVKGKFLWTTKKGKTGSMALEHGWLTVRDALRLPEPDTSWMSEPWSRSRFTGWMG